MCMYKSKGWRTLGRFVRLWTIKDCYYYHYYSLWHAFSKLKKKEFWKWDETRNMHVNEILCILIINCETYSQVYLFIFFINIESMFPQEICKKSISKGQLVFWFSDDSKFNLPWTWGFLSRTVNRLSESNR